MSGDAFTQYLMQQVTTLNTLMMDMKEDIGSVKNDFDHVKSEVKILRDGHIDQEDAINKLEKDFEVLMMKVQEFTENMKILMSKTKTDVHVNADTNISGVSGDANIEQTVKK